MTAREGPGRLRFAVVVLILLAGSACEAVPSSPPPSPPATPPPSPPSAALPTGTLAPLSGDTVIRLEGRVRGPCAMPPSGCGHWVTLVLPGGDTRRAEIQVDTAGAATAGAGRITGAGPELPASLPDGRFGLVFEAAEFSDVASPSTLPDGSVVYPPEQPVGGARPSSRPGTSRA